MTQRCMLGLLISALALATVPPAHAGDDLAISQRADEALMWQRKSRDDLAADIWRRILVLDPNHPLALLNLGLIEARAGHPAEARALLIRAQRLKKPPMGLSRLEMALADQPDVPPSPEYAEPAALAAKMDRDERAEPPEARTSSTRKRRASEARAEPDASADTESTSARRSRKARAEEPRRAEVASATSTTSPAPELSAASTSSTRGESTVPVVSGSVASARSAATVASAPPLTNSANLSGAKSNSSTARVAVPEADPGADDERSPAIPFPELASQLPMGTTLARPPVARLEASSSGVVVKGKPRPTKPLPFLPPPL